MSRVLIEACCGSVEEAIAAQEAGADRIELCAALPTGGVTPSVGMLREARANVRIPIVAMVRPREGGACPHEMDFRAAVRDVEACFENGADEVICGVLDAGLKVDIDRNREFLSAGNGRPMAFHRVFDMTPDREESLEALIELGFCRVLTSGGAATVELGLDELRRLIERAGARIMILPGGGVRPPNVARLIQTGCRELHFSFREATDAEGYGGVQDFRAIPERIAAIKAIVDSQVPEA